MRSAVLWSFYASRASRSDWAWGVSLSVGSSNSSPLNIEPRYALRTISELMSSLGVPSARTLPEFMM